MRWVYLSPHFDDVILSSAGLVWEQVQVGPAGGNMDDMRRNAGKGCFSINLRASTARALAN